MGDYKRKMDLIYSSNIQSENYQDSTQKLQGLMLSTESKQVFGFSLGTTKSSKQYFLSVLWWLPSGMTDPLGLVNMNCAC